MKLFVASLIVISLALLASSKLAFRMRRSRLLTMLFSGGWITLGAGVLIQFASADLSSGEVLLDARPIIMTALGWIGLMVGMQARRDVLRSLPVRVWRMAIADSIACIALFGVFATAMLVLWSGRSFTETGALAVIEPALMLAAAGIGWSLETRSLSIDRDTHDEKASAMLRSSGSLCVIFAISIYGFFELLVGRTALLGESFDLLVALRQVVTTVALALSMGFIGRYGLRVAGRHRPEQLIVFLGLVAFVAGIASQLGISPLFASMLTGVVIANLAGNDLRLFERFILQAEPIVGAVFALIAGLLLELRIGAVEIGFAMGIVALRALAKPMLWSAFGREPGTGSKGWVSIAPIRQGRLAIALGVSLFLVVPSDLTERLLTVIVLAGLICDLLTLAILRLGGGQRVESDTPMQEASA
ncbi:MAG: hypothetical protein RLN60_05130 [Phycisphaerales bacterium]